MIPGQPQINLDKDELNPKDNNIERQKDGKKKTFLRHSNFLKK